jgi:hypothetical protein
LRFDDADPFGFTFTPDPGLDIFFTMILIPFINLTWYKRDKKIALLTIKRDKFPHCRAGCQAIFIQSFRHNSFSEMA